MKEQQEQQVPPKLLMASSEIKAILQQYDLAGLVVIHCPDPGGDGPGFIKHVEVLGPSYSCVEFNGRNLEVRELPPPSLVGDDPELPRKRVIRSTLNMLFNIRMKAVQLVGLFVQAEMELRSRFQIKKPGSNGQDILGKGGLGL